MCDIQPMLSTMSAFADTLYHQPYINDKKEVYLEFIRKVLTMYQQYKNRFIKFAPDVCFEDIKSSGFVCVCLTSSQQLSASRLPERFSLHRRYKNAGYDALRGSSAPSSRQAAAAPGGQLALRAAPHERNVRPPIHLPELCVVDADPADLDYAADEQQSSFHGADSHVADPLPAAKLASFHAFGGPFDGRRADGSDGPGRHRYGKLGSDVLDAGAGCEAR